GVPPDARGARLGPAPARRLRRGRRPHDRVRGADGGRGRRGAGPGARGGRRGGTVTAEARPAGEVGASDGEPRILWTPPADARTSTGMGRYLGWLEQHHGLAFATYDDLWRWSVDDLP